MDIIRKKRMPKPSIVFDTYWKFAVERQAIFFRRINNGLIWTSDPIFEKHKFTNAYRASDRVSQYLIKEIIYKGTQTPEEVFFRILLFKSFNKIETWELLKHEFGEISYKTYSFEKYNRVFNEALKSGESIYSGAYIMASGKSSFNFDRKHQNHLKLIEYMIKSDAPKTISQAKSLEEIYWVLMGFPTIGSFLAYQYTIDINYSELVSFSEMDFVIPGPGAKDGIKKCFVDLGDYSECELIKWVTEMQDDEFNRLNLSFQDLWGRSLQLIDCQNLFCEVDKYARVAHPEITGLSDRKRIKQLFRPKGEVIDYWYPPKWNINDKIRNTAYGKREECVYQSL